MGVVKTLRYEQRKRMSKIDTLTSIVTQLDVQFVKTPEQTNYVPVIARCPV